MIAPCTYYANKARPYPARQMRDIAVMVTIWDIYCESKCLYGARKIWHQITRGGGVNDKPVPRCQVERLMKTLGIQGVTRERRAWKTTVADKNAVFPTDLVERNFTATHPNQIWVLDITYVRLANGKAYTALITDIYGRPIVGWSTATTMNVDLVKNALAMAVALRGREDHTVIGTIHHSDHGSQYTDHTYTKQLLDAGLIASMGTVGDSYDNALAETVNGLYKTELINKHEPFTNLAELTAATSEWIHWYNTTRLHSSIGYMPPAEYEKMYYNQTETTQSAT